MKEKKEKKSQRRVKDASRNGGRWKNEKMTDRKVGVEDILKIKRKETASQKKEQKCLIQLTSERVLNFKYDKSTEAGPCLKLSLCFIQANINCSFYTRI